MSGLTYVVHPRSMSAYEEVVADHPSWDLKLEADPSVGEGLVVISGLNPSTPYLLAEMTAPDGYTLLAQPVPFSFDSTRKVTLGLPDQEPQAVTFEGNRIVVADNRVVALPFTGAVDVSPLLWILGAALMASTVVWRLRRQPTP